MSWHMATARLSGHCGISICFHAVDLVSHSQYSWAVRMTQASANRTAMQNRLRFGRRARLIRMMENKIERRADLYDERVKWEFGDQIGSLWKRKDG